MNTTYINRISVVVNEKKTEVSMALSMVAPTIDLAGKVTGEAEIEPISVIMSADIAQSLANIINGLLTPETNGEKNGHA